MRVVKRRDVSKKISQKSISYLRKQSLRARKKLLYKALVEWKAGKRTRRPFLKQPMPREMVEYICNKAGVDVSEIFVPVEEPWDPIYRPFGNRKRKLPNPPRDTARARFNYQKTSYPTRRERITRETRYEQVRELLTDCIGDALAQARQREEE